MQMVKARPWKGGQEAKAGIWTILELRCRLDLHPSYWSSSL